VPLEAVAVLLVEAAGLCEVVEVSVGEGSFDKVFVFDADCVVERELDGDDVGDAVFEAERLVDCDDVIAELGVSVLDVLPVSAFDAVSVNVRVRVIVSLSVDEIELVNT